MRTSIRALALVLSGVALSAYADTVHLKNGDRITGKVVTKSDVTLTVRTDAAGELKIRWADVMSIRTDEAVDVLLQDGRKARTTVLGAEPGEIRDEPPMSLDLVAYINPAKYESGEGIVYSGKVLLAATMARGNTDTNRFYGEGTLGGRARDYRFALSAKGAYGEDHNSRSEANWLTNASYDRFLTRKHFVYGRTSFEHDDFADVELRQTYGVGYGHQFFETADASFSIQGGPEYVILNRVVGDDEKYPAAGWGVRYMQWVFNRRAQVFHEHDGFWSLRDTGDVVIRSKTGLRVPLTHALDMTAQVNVDWESDPSPGRKRTDSIWLVGLGYTF
jgi:putative salt-induced outer membrane protein YdiY